MENSNYDFTSTDPAVTQDRLNTEMVESGQQRRFSQITRAIAGGRGADTPGGRKLTGHLIDDVTDALVEKVQASITGRPGKHHTGLRHIYAAAMTFTDATDQRAFYERVAVIAIRTTLSMVRSREGKDRLSSTVATAIGNDIADELLADKFQQEEPALFKATVRNARKRLASPRHVALAVRKADRKFELGLRPEWPVVRVGLAVLTRLLDLQTFITIDERLGGRRSGGNYVVLAPGAMEWLRNVDERNVELAARYLPTVVAPEPWTGVRSGGYEHEVFQRPVPFVKDMRPAHRAALEAADLSHVYAAVNAVQSTPWRINERVLAVAEHFWSNGIVAAGVPAREPVAAPIKTTEVINDAKGGEIGRAYARRAHDVIVENMRSASGRMAVERALSIAKKFAPAAAIYFPHNVDWRGRAYPLPTELAPNGDDLNKGLLTFAHGKPLGTNGARWLAIQGANVFGKDKLPFADRIAWANADETKSMVKRVAANPLGNRAYWTDADEPWQFLAWCFEWADYLASGLGSDHVSCLPVTIDGTCNGLQHFAAILRDETTGALVNLLQSDTPQDIYQTVADALNAQLKADRHVDAPSAYASAWLEFGIDRSFTKPLVMTLPYGSTRRGRRDKIRDAVKQRTDELGHCPFGGSDRDAVSYLAGIVERVLSERLRSALPLTSYLQSVARASLAANPLTPITWTAPSGFPVVSDLRKDERGQRIETHLGGRVVQLSTRRETEEQDKDEHRKGIAPNFIQSLDAAHLVATVNAAAADGVEGFVVRHDCFGTHAADVETLAGVVRDTWVEQYADGGDVLVRLPNVAELKRPERGELEIGQVVGADYFFH